MLGNIIRWLKEVVFGWLQKDLYPEYVAKVRQLEADNEALRERVAQREKEAAEADARIRQREADIEAREAQIVADQKVVAENQKAIEQVRTELAEKLKQVEDAESIEDVLKVK